VIPGATGETHEFMSNDGDYRLQVTTSLGGKLWSNVVTVIIGSTDQSLLPENSLKISPNPFTNFVQVNINLDQRSEMQLDLFSIDGKLIKSWEIDSAGVYQFELKAGGQSISKKVVKQ